MHGTRVVLEVLGLLRFFHHPSPALLAYRNRQNRPVTESPFEREKLPPKPELPDVESCGQKSSDDDDSKTLNEPSTDELQPKGSGSGDEQDNPVPRWLNLLFDVSWTATFSNLTNNARFMESWGSVSYAFFFTTAWWLWVSYVLYSVQFATNDWFHLLSIFLHLIIFGSLAAASRGFDVTNYILHSPGSQESEPYDLAAATPDWFRDERFTKVSLQVIIISIAISRVLLLVQHLRVVYYALCTSKPKQNHLQFLIVPVSLVVSGTLFFTAYKLNMTAFGRTSYGAKIKFVLWGLALLVEIVAQVVRLEMKIENVEGLRLKWTSSIVGRFQDMTIIILRESINEIAGSFYAIERAPGFKCPTGTGIVCCAIIVFLLAYLYFNGPAPPKRVRRQTAWVMMHLPWLLSVVLLLQGVKNQLLLTNFLSSETHMIESLHNGLSSIISSEAQFNATMRPILLQTGMSWDDEYAYLNRMVQVNTTSNPNRNNDREAILADIKDVWYLRIMMKGALDAFTTFMGNDTILDTTRQIAQRYLDDYSYTLEDVYNIRAPNGDNWHLLEVVNELVEPSLKNTRYIMAICGATFITLASLNLIESWPRDRFQWASIFSRYAMGIVMVMLLLLNLGEYQVYLDVDVPQSQRTSVLRWMNANWVLPTIALAYFMQFFMDT
ncbi:hypothetical protein FRC06_003265, partial [Ceratobasidium sp. 370]